MPLTSKENQDKARRDNTRQSQDAATTTKKQGKRMKRITTKIRTQANKDTGKDANTKT